MAGGWTSGCSNLAVRSPRSQRQGGYGPTGYPPVCLWAGGSSWEGRDGWPRGLAPQTLRARYLLPAAALGPCSITQACSVAWALFPGLEGIQSLPDTGLCPATAFSPYAVNSPVWALEDPCLLGSSA